MIFPADDIAADTPKPTPLYAATASSSRANLWTSINGFAAVRVFTAVENEYRAAKDGAVIADFGPLARYAVRGGDAAAFLTRVATAPARDLGEGESARGLILDDAGGVMDLAEISRLTKDLFILTTPTPQPRAIQLAARGLDVEVEDVAPAVAAIGVLGVGAKTALSTAGLKVPSDYVAASSVVRGVETAARPVQFGAMAGVELIFPADDALTVWERMMRHGAVTPIGLDALEVLRIESGAPRPGVDFITRTPRPGSRRALPGEIGLPHLAPLNAGWFNGRRALRFRAPPVETRLVTLGVDADHVLPGAAVLAAGKAVGRITSSAWSPTLRRVIAFARINGSSNSKTTEFSVSAANGDDQTAHIVGSSESRLADAYRAASDAATEIGGRRV